MEKITPTQSLYIKLGRRGEYERECLTSPGMLHVGWTEIDHQMCIDGDWAGVWQVHLQIYNGREQVATNQTNQLKLFYESGEDVIWITFYQDRLYWCFARNEISLQPDNSRIRHTLHGWSDCDLNGKILDVGRLSGSLLAIQGFRSVICKVREKDYLVRKINCDSSLTEAKAIEARHALILSLVPIIQELNWKEFELLADLIFRQAGWQRVGAVGKSVKGIDLDLLSPITRERFKIQVKSSAGEPELQELSALANQNVNYAHYYLVVHQPTQRLIDAAKKTRVKLWLPGDIASLVVNYGLVDWVIAKAK